MPCRPHSPLPPAAGRRRSGCPSGWPASQRCPDAPACPASGGPGPAPPPPASGWSPGYLRSRPAPSGRSGEHLPGRCGRAPPRWPPWQPAPSSRRDTPGILARPSWQSDQGQSLGRQSRPPAPGTARLRRRPGQRPGGSRRAAVTALLWAGRRGTAGWSPAHSAPPPGPRSDQPDSSGTSTSSPSTIAMCQPVICWAAGRPCALGLGGSSVHRWLRR